MIVDNQYGCIMADEMGLGKVHSRMIHTICRCSFTLTDGAIDLAAGVSGRDARYLGSFPGCVACFYLAQLAAGNHPLCAKVEGAALLG